MSERSHLTADKWTYEILADYIDQAYGDLDKGIHKKDVWEIIRKYSPEAWGGKSQNATPHLVDLLKKNGWTVYESLDVKIKMFEEFIVEKEEKFTDAELVSIFKQMWDKNQDKDTHDFFMFVAKPGFKETSEGNYKKSLDIENMVLIKPDIQSIRNMQGLQMRAAMTHQKLYSIWLPNEITPDIEGKGDDIPFWLLELIDKHKINAFAGSDVGKQQLADAITKVKSAYSNGANYGI